MYANSSQCVREILVRDAPKRQYKRKEAGPDDEKTRVRITLLEYGNKSLIGPSFGVTAMKKSDSDAVVEDELAAEVSASILHTLRAYVDKCTTGQKSYSAAEMNLFHSISRCVSSSCQI